MRSQGAWTGISIEDGASGKGRANCERPVSIGWLFSTPHPDYVALYFSIKSSQLHLHQTSTSRPCPALAPPLPRPCPGTVLRDCCTETRPKTHQNWRLPYSSKQTHPTLVPPFPPFPPLLAAPAGTLMGPPLRPISIFSDKGWEGWGTFCTVGYTETRPTKS